MNIVSKGTVTTEGRGRYGERVEVEETEREIEGREGEREREEKEKDRVESVVWKDKDGDQVRSGEGEDIAGLHKRSQHNHKNNQLSMDRKVTEAIEESRLE